MTVGVPLLVHCTIPEGQEVLPFRLLAGHEERGNGVDEAEEHERGQDKGSIATDDLGRHPPRLPETVRYLGQVPSAARVDLDPAEGPARGEQEEVARSEEHTSELQSQSNLL